MFSPVTLRVCVTSSTRGVGNISSLKTWGGTAHFSQGIPRSWPYRPYDRLFGTLVDENVRVSCPSVLLFLFLDGERKSFIHKGSFSMSLFMI